MKKSKKPAGKPCGATVSGLVCVLEAGHGAGHSSAAPGRKKGQHATWLELEDGRIHVVTFTNGKRMGDWYEDPPRAPEEPEEPPEPDEDDDDPLEDEIRSDQERDFARKMREDREAYAREFEADPHDGTTCGIVDGRGDGCIHKQGHDGPHSNGKRTWPNRPPKKVSKIYTKAEREQLEALAARAPTKHIKVHPAADALPMIEGAEFDAFVADIRANGLQHRPVLDHTGTWLVDGRNRKRACEALGIEVEYDRLPEGTNIAAYVISTNLKRRNLDESQRAIIAAEIANLAQGQRKQTGPGAGVTQAEAAAGADVGERTVRRANAVRNKAVPEIVAAVKSGKVDLRGAEEVARLSPAEQRKVYKERIEPAKGKVRAGKLASLARQEKKRAIVRSINEQRVAPAPMGPFGLIVVDPPWPYENSDQHDGSRGHIDYPPMSLDAICALRDEIDRRAKDDCILGLWITNAFVHELGRVLTAWGFIHRTMYTWDKELEGIGTWGRGRTEHLVIASRGEPAHTLNELSTYLAARRREHSRKPDEMYRLLAKHCAGPALDMFAREQREGFEVWGAETRKFAPEAA